MTYFISLYFYDDIFTYDIFKTLKGNFSYFFVIRKKYIYVYSTEPNPNTFLIYYYSISKY